MELHEAAEQKETLPVGQDALRREDRRILPIRRAGQKNPRV